MSKHAPRPLCGGSDGGTTKTRAAHEAPAAPNRPASEEAASAAHLSGPDCRALRALVVRRAGNRLAMRAETTPPLSRCRMRGHRVEINVYLDAGYGARQRYLNRMVEQVQFNAPDAAKIPHPVAGVGDRSAGEHYASWIPAYSTLFAVRGNRWLTVAYAAATLPRTARLRLATALARQAFRLSAG